MRNAIFGTGFLLLVLLACSGEFQTATAEADSASRLINGSEVPAGQFPEVIRIVTGNSGCSAAIVGPRAILTAAHCAQNGSTSKFKVGGIEYSAKISRSPVYPSKDHDVSLGYVDKEIQGVTPGTIYQGALKAGDEVTLFGYGCTTPGGGGGNDGKLRMGTNEVKGFSNYDVVVGPKSGGAALCFGDSGGPMMIKLSRGYSIAAVNSKGNIKDLSYIASLVTQESKTFLAAWASANKTDLCGVTKDCSNPGPGPKSFDIENVAAKITVVDKGFHQDGFVQRVFEQVMMYLVDVQNPSQNAGGPVLPLPEILACQCQDGSRALCDQSGVGKCQGTETCTCQ